VTTDGESRLWKWTELPRFATFCRDICERLGIPYEGAFDEVRWSIEENICRNPFRVSHPDSRFDGEQWRYFRTIDAPARMDVPALVVTFHVVRYPEFGSSGILEGREVWIEEELRQIGFSLGVDEETS